MIKLITNKFYFLDRIKNHVKYYDKKPWQVVRKISKAKIMSNAVIKDRAVLIKSKSCQIPNQKITPKTMPSQNDRLLN